MDSEDKQRVSLYLDREAMKTVDVFSDTKKNVVSV